MGKSVVAVRIDDEVKEQWRQLAIKHGRSFGGYIEQVIRLMNDRELLNDVSALDVIADRLVTISNRLEEIVLQGNKKKVKVPRLGDERKLTAYDMEYEDFLCEEYWRMWVDHLHKSEVHLNHYQGQRQYARFKEIDEEGFNCESLIEELIKRTAKTIYIPFEWIQAAKEKASKRSGK